jgi:hypothetical protein
MVEDLDPAIREVLQASVRMIEQFGYCTKQDVLFFDTDADFSTSKRPFDFDVFVSRIDLPINIRSVNILGAIVLASHMYGKNIGETDLKTYMFGKEQKHKTSMDIGIVGKTVRHVIKMSEKQIGFIETLDEPVAEWIKIVSELT